MGLAQSWSWQVSDRDRGDAAAAAGLFESL